MVVVGGEPGEQRDRAVGVEMKLEERLEKYQMVLKQLDICTKELTAAGFVRDDDNKKAEKFVLSELRRTERALRAMGRAPVPQMPGRERVVPAQEEHSGNVEIVLEPPGGATAKAAKANGAAV
ncbi:MAG: hypothetical protein NVS9B14_06450 [Candidatus Acidiferrum sp.]